MSRKGSTEPVRTACGTNGTALKDITTATIYANENVLKSAPRHTHIQELKFFTLNTYVSDDELEREYESRGLEPADIYSLARWEESNKDREDKRYIATHWKDAQSKWCYATFGRWLGRRRVSVDRDGHGWYDNWWFVGVPVHKSSELKSINATTQLKELEEKIVSECQSELFKGAWNDTGADFNIRLNNQRRVLEKYLSTYRGGIAEMARQMKKDLPDNVEHPDYERFCENSRIWDDALEAFAEKLTKNV